MIKTTRNSFTLIELIIVIAILGILAFMISGNFLTSLKKGRDAKRKADLENIQKAVEMYYEDTKEYPEALTFGTSLTDTTGEKKYMQVIPNDPVAEKDYTYVSDGQTYQIYACLENNQQMLPYVSTGTGTPECTVACEDQNGDPVEKCIYGISSSNSVP